jgi:O-antigen/teichoic acid export membrane protein
MNIFSIRKYITLKAFDITTSDGRTNERYRLATLSLAASVLSRGAAMLLMILTVSLTLPYLGVERFGVWMTIASFAVMLSFLDMGISNSLTNRVSYAATKNDFLFLQTTISCGLLFLLLIATTIGLSLNFLFGMMPWNTIFKTTDYSANLETINAVKVFALLFALSLFSSGLQRVFAGLQKAYHAHLISLLGSLLSIITLCYAASLKLGISELLFSTFGIQLLTNLLLIIVLYKKKLLILISSFEVFRNESKILISSSGLFFILQIGTMIGWGVDNLLISSVLGSAQVAIFSVVQRLFQFITQPLAMVNSPLWAAYADANIRKEKEFIRTTLIRSMALTFFFSFLGGALILFNNESIISTWTRSTLLAPIYLVVAYYIWSILESLGNSFAMMMNGCEIIKPQVYALITLVSVSIPLKIYLLNNYGLAEMLAGFSILYITNIFFWYGIVFKSEIKRKITN